MGSFPLTRGKHRADRVEVHDDGLIPTHAGKTASALLHRDKRGAHPHSRGENLEDHWEVLEADGSSPLTRGKLEGIGVATGHGGLIPTHAGKTSS